MYPYHRARELFALLGDFTANMPDEMNLILSW